MYKNTKTNLTTEALHKDVIEGCRKGDRRSQEALYRAYYKSMMSLCLRYTQNDADAVEALNNGFLKVFQNIHRYDPGVAGFYTWIRTVVVNSCLDFIKSRNRTTSHRELTDNTEVHLPPEILSKIKAAELLVLVRSLPPSTSAVFNLYVIEGYNHKEIGKLLGISEGTSKWHLSEARKGLQQKLKLQNV